MTTPPKMSTQNVIKSNDPIKYYDLPLVLTNQIVILTYPYFINIKPSLDQPFLSVFPNLFRFVNSVNK